VVGADELGGEAAACGAVDGVAEDLSVAVDNTILAGEEFVLGMDVEGVGQLLGGSQLTTQVFAVDPEAQLVGDGSLILDAVVDVVVGYAGSGAEGYLASEVGKEIESVVMVVFDDGELAVEHHPMDEVRQLAHASADAFRGFALGNGESFLVALAPRGATYHLPYGEGLARTDEQSVDMADGECQVGGFILLQLHVDLAESAPDE